MNGTVALPRVALAVVLMVGGLAVALAAPRTVLAGDPCFHGYSIPPSTTADTDAVGMEPCAFVPTNVRVAPGTTVTFTNTSGEIHLLTGANQEWGDRERKILPGEAVTVTFDTPGVYAFSCALHVGMSGAVIVEDPSAAAAAATPATAAAVRTTGSTDDGAAVVAA
ncbi:MAG TPA: plastocyanin/azurin family copper-binding protein, partial [Candidatus Binatia bacterium]|nr:plastocyanin/azurin family copper-binding protein [Candidatus Binatia bacterium]